MIFQQCPICGRYMIPNMSETSGWYQCVCGYDTRSYLYTYSNYSSDFDYGERKRRMARRLKDIIIHMDYEDEYKDGKAEVNIIASEPEELVICKNCKRRGKPMICPMWDQKLSDYDYCSYGEKRGKEHD